MSIIVPTRDQAALFAACIGSILNGTRYPAFEIVVVDNGSVEAEARALLEGLAARPDVRVMHQPGPFNYSALNNAAAAVASGDVLAFLNNDVEVVSEDWLSEMAGLAANPEIGCVGAMLLYPDRTIQHAGLALGLNGGAAHVLRGRSPDDATLGHLLASQRNVAAVTGACLVVRKHLFQSVGGFDAESLAISYNDVDLCLKVSALGYRNVWTPRAKLIHHEMASRGADDTPEKISLARRELAAMHQRWGTRMVRDPYYSPNLTIDSDDMSVRAR